MKRGEWLSIVGHNGSGKSTTIRLIDGLLEAESGKSGLMGNCCPLRTFGTYAVKLVWFFKIQITNLWGATVEDDVAFGLENQGLPREEMKKRVAESLELVGMLDFKKREPARLSGGQNNGWLLQELLP